MFFFLVLDSLLDPIAWGIALLGGIAGLIVGGLAFRLRSFSVLLVIADYAAFVAFLAVTFGLFTRYTRMTTGTGVASWPWMLVLMAILALPSAAACALVQAVRLAWRRYRALPKAP